MFDLYFWAHLPLDLCHDQAHVQESVTKAKRAVQKLEAKVLKCKASLTSLALLNDIDDTELYNYEDRIEVLLQQLITQRRKLLKKSFNYCISKLNAVEKAIKTDEQVESNYIPKVAFFCKDVLRRIIYEVPLHLAEIDTHMFLQLKEAAANCLKSIIDKVKAQLGNEVLVKRPQIAEEELAKKHFKANENSNVLVE